MPEWMRNRFWGPSGNGLLNNLIAYWPGNEVAGNALDLHTNALHLTDINTVTSNPGLVYPLARQYTLANLEYHTRAHEALLAAGDIDFTLAAWVRTDTMPPGAAYAVMDKYAAPNGYAIQILGFGIDRFHFEIFNGVSVGTINAVTLGLPVVNTWYLIVAWHDSVANTVSIQADNGIVDSAATTGVPADSGGAFGLGARAPGANHYYWNGRIGPSMFWKSVAGAGGVLTVAQRTALWNGGAGLTYAAFTV